MLPFSRAQRETPTTHWERLRHERSWPKLQHAHGNQISRMSMQPPLQAAHLMVSYRSATHLFVKKPPKSVLPPRANAQFAPPRKYDRNWPIACKPRERDSGWGAHQRCAGSWPSPRATYQTSAEPKGARAPSQKTLLRTRRRGWNGCLALWVARGHQRAAQEPTCAPTLQEAPTPPQRRPQTGNLGGLPSRQIPKPRSAGACAHHKGQGSRMNTSCARDQAQQ